jgi:murein DD-endopeptidase MepM/ murein hydrolase activator NlpD
VDGNQVLINSGSQTSYTANLNYGSHSWKARTKNSAGVYGAWSATWSFTLQKHVSELPAPVLSLHPGENVPVGTQAILSWTSIAEATGYRLFYGPSSGNYSGSWVLGKINEFLFVVENDDDYFFCVKPYNVPNELEGTCSNEVHLMATAPEKLAAPRIVAPLTDEYIVSSSLSFELKWEPLSSAVAYQLLIDDSLNVDIPQGSQSSYTATVRGFGRHKWKIRAIAADSGPGYWSEVVSFVLISSDQGSNPKSFVYPIDNLPGDSSCPSDSGEPKRTTDARSWYSVVWGGKYNGNWKERCKGSGGHPGVDIRVESGTQVKAVSSGTVRISRDDSSWGGLIVIQHEDPDLQGKSIWSVYAHLKEKYLEAGQIIPYPGYPIGLSGGAVNDPNHGSSDGPHLHFQIEKGDTFINPYWPATGSEVPDKNLANRTVDPIAFIARHSNSPSTPIYPPRPPVLEILTDKMTVFLSWNAIPEADGYTLYYSRYPSTDLTERADMQKQTSLAVDLLPGDAYYVAVEACNAAGSSGLSNVEHFIIANKMRIKRYNDRSNSFVLVTRDVQEGDDYLITKVILRSLAGCWYMVTPNFKRNGSPVSVTDVYYLPPFGEIVIDNSLRIEKGQYLHLDLSREEAGAQIMTGLDVILRGFFSKRLEDLLGSKKEQLDLLLDILYEAGVLDNFTRGTVYLYQGEYVDAATEYIGGIKKAVDFFGEDKMDDIFRAVLGHSGSVIWKKGISLFMEALGVPAKYYLLKDVLDNYILRPGPWTGYVRLEAVQSRRSLF